MEATGLRDISGVSVGDRRVKGRLAFSIALTAVIFVVELAGGYYTNSLALMSDAAHVFMDVFALALSWFALHISSLPPTRKRTYGLHRVEVFVSFINSAMLFAITAFITYEAYQRFFAPRPVESVVMMIIAVIGLVVNLVVALWLRGFAGSDLNLKSAYLHVLGDAAASVGVIVGAALIYYTGINRIDPVISVIICAIILYGAYGIMRDASHILLEGVPRDIDVGGVVSDIMLVAGVTGVHSLHIWSICHNVNALSAHIDIEPEQRRRTGEIYAAVNARLAEAHHIFYTTLQAECTGCDRDGLFRRMEHGNHNHANHVH